jgi:hypothetical protein
MTRASQVLLAVAAVIAGAVAVHVAMRISQPPEPAPRTAAPGTAARAPEPAPAPSPIYPAAADSMPAGSAERNRGLALEIEGALASLDARRIETVFGTLLPELLAADAGSVAAMLARQQTGPARDLLREELARQWVRHDRDSAIAWVKSLEDTAERRHAATTAMRAMAASDPAQAIIVADELGVGRDDGSLEHIVQIWAASDPEAARRWLAAQPPGDASVAALRARIEGAAARH